MRGHSSSVVRADDANPSLPRSERTEYLPLSLVRAGAEYLLIEVQRRTGYGCANDRRRGRFGGCCQYLNRFLNLNRLARTQRDAMNLDAELE